MQPLGWWFVPGFRVEQLPAEERNEKEGETHKRTDILDRLMRGEWVIDWSLPKKEVKRRKRKI